jgi:hypothetical protein
VLPPGCEPIDLRDPNGDRINLEGTWIHAAPGQEMTWWLRTEGNCVWGAGLIPRILTPGDDTAPHDIQSLNGHLGGDFVISGEILYLTGAEAPLRPYAPLRMLVEFDDGGGLVLREDRVAGVIGPRCPILEYCPAPLVLERAD